MQRKVNKNITRRIETKCIFLYYNGKSCKRKHSDQGPYNVLMSLRKKKKSTFLRTYYKCKVNFTTVVIKWWWSTIVFAPWENELTIYLGWGNEGTGNREAYDWVNDGDFVKSPRRRNPSRSTEEEYKPFERNR